jgi:methionyl aminopeptidase
MRTVCRVSLPFLERPLVCLKPSLQMAREVLDIAAASVRPGITTDEIDAIVHDATLERNAYPSDLNYRNFPKSVCT